MKEDRLYLEHMLTAAQRILDYVGDGREAFMRDPRTQDAVVRNFEIIGEAAKRVSATTREACPEIPWRPLAGFRDVLIHRYETVDLEAVWQVVEANLPPLVVAVQTLLESYSEPDTPASAPLQ